ncbi:hypothetical protein [Streptantibioticus silvisoli]|uniref:Uncharacterized protein n=1 Tax=Streptantibioticus silvisoli TaxID=2705255 RepID=A0ABT6W302_9ACTN|nr:hypothetical protein [Streptantibioticus silvisoli]MDI5965123.1 hypothetical protein [Streptantibioticus silvisoli]
MYGIVRYTAVRNAPDVVGARRGAPLVVGVVDRPRDLARPVTAA